MSRTIIAQGVGAVVLGLAVFVGTFLLMCHDAGVSPIDLFRAAAEP